MKARREPRLRARLARSRPRGFRSLARSARRSALPVRATTRRTAFLRPCNLVAKFTGQHVDPAWSSHDVLDKAQAFLLDTSISLDFWSYFCLPPMSRISDNDIERRRV
jgi:hypothetical protein